MWPSTLPTEPNHHFSFRGNKKDIQHKKFSMQTSLLHLLLSLQFLPFHQSHSTFQLRSHASCNQEECLLISGQRQASGFCYLTLVCKVQKKYDCHLWTVIHDSRQWWWIDEISVRPLLLFKNSHECANKDTEIIKTLANSSVFNSCRNQDDSWQLLQ